MKLVADYKDGDRLTSQLLIVNALKGVTNNGLTYFTLDLRDSSGQINAKKWEVTAEDEAIFVPGNVIEATFEVIFYKNSLQLKIFSAKALKEDEIDISLFAKQAPVAYEVLIEKLHNHINSITDDELKSLKSVIRKTKTSKTIRCRCQIIIDLDEAHGKAISFSRFDA